MRTVQYPTTGQVRLFVFIHGYEKFPIEYADIAVKIFLYQSGISYGALY